MVKIITRWKGKPCNQNEKKAQLTKSLLKSLSSWSIKFGGTEKWILLQSAMQRSETSNNANSMYNIFSRSRIFEMQREAQGAHYCCSLECCFSRKGDKKWILSYFHLKQLLLLKSQGDVIERIGSQRKKNNDYRKQSQFSFVLVLIWIETWVFTEYGDFLTSSQTAVYRAYWGFAPVCNTKPSL